MTKEIAEIVEQAPSHRGYAEDLFAQIAQPYNRNWI